MRSTPHKDSMTDMEKKSRQRWKKLCLFLMNMALKTTNTFKGKKFSKIVNKVLENLLS